MCDFHLVVFRKTTSASSPSSSSSFYEKVEKKSTAPPVDTDKQKSSSELTKKQMLSRSIHKLTFSNTALTQTVLTHFRFSHPCGFSDICGPRLSCSSAHMLRSSSPRKYSDLLQSLLGLLLYWMKIQLWYNFRPIVC